MEEPQIACTLCHSTFDKSRTYALGLHMNSHINDSLFECPDCADLFQDLDHFQEHMQSLHGETIYELIKAQIEELDANSDDAASTNNHHLDYSSDASKSSNHLQNDKKVGVPPDDDKPKCVECGKELIPLQSDSIKRKQKTCQECRQLTIPVTLQKTYKCEMCNKEFPTLLSVRLHRRIHSGLCFMKMTEYHNNCFFLIIRRSTV